MNTNLDKYGDAELHESLADVHLFLPMSDLFVDICYKLGITPNVVTITSTIATLASAYFYYKGKLCITFLLYFIGYLFDCLDGRLARKYNQSSTFGMLLDSVSDMVTNIPFMIIFVIRTYQEVSSGNNRCKLILLLMIFFVVYIFGMAYGLNEAITTFEEIGDDNFYLHKKKIINNRYGLLGKAFLIIYQNSYNAYRVAFPKPINKECLPEYKRKLLSLKEFGPGNISLFMMVCMYMYHK